MIKPAVAHFTLVQGRAQELAPYLGIFDEASPALYILAEPVVGEEDCHELMESVAETFTGWSQSLTSGLRVAFKEVHGRLAQGGRQAGMACLALKGQRLYGAVAGPVGVYLFSLGRLYRPVTGEESPALGSGAEPQLQLWSHIPREGDVVLLAQSSLARLVSWEALTVILESEITTAAQRLYYLAEDEPRFAVLLLSFRPGTA